MMINGRGSGSGREAPRVEVFVHHLGGATDPFGAGHVTGWAFWICSSGRGAHAACGRSGHPPRLKRAWRSGSTERLSEGLPRGILPSGFLFVPDRPPMGERVQFPPLDAHELEAFCGGQVEANAFHESSLGDG